MPAPVAPSWIPTLVPALISALAALGGVAVGGWITSRNQRLERQHRRLQEQLGFYATLHGLRMGIRAKSEVREKVRGIAEQAFQREYEGVEDPGAREKIVVERWPQYEKLFTYDEQQLTQELIPLYRKMLDHWTNNMALSEPSTQKHYPLLVEYVEIWNRFLQKAIPNTVVPELRHEEKKLYPLYEDIEEQVTRLRKELNK
jgi:hypothetical protein